LRALLIPILVVSLFLAAPAVASDLFIVQGARDNSYSEVLSGFKNSCAAKSRVVVLSDYSEVDIGRIVQEEQPTAILAIGEAALTAVKKIRHVPVISLMSLGLSMGKSIPANVTGVGMVIPSEQYMTLFKALQLRRIGVVYDPTRSGDYLKRARQAAARAGIELVLREVHNPREIPRQLSSLKGSVDALWLLPDSTAVTQETVDAYFYFSMEEGKPVIAFSGVYLSMGAAASLEIDLFEMGKQAGEMANLILNGSSPDSLLFHAPRTIFLKTNRSVARKLELNLRNLETLPFTWRN
jgi:putative tryptophan/tyrosine transport system substrate-binding protein